MAGVSEKDLETSIKSILKGADLQTLSAKKIRRKLEEKFSTDLTDRKEEIDKLVMRLLTESSDSSSKKNEGQKDAEENGQEEDHVDTSSEEQEAEPAHPPAPKKKKAEAARPVKLKSKPPAKRKEVITNDTISDSDKSGDEDVDDARLAQKLQQEEMNLRYRPSKKATKPKKEKAAKKERKGVSMYSQPCQLSDDLAAVMGTDKMTRHDVVKRMWELVRERDLQDPKNKQFMLCDDQMQKLFGKKRVRMFGMMKTLKNHIRDMKDLAP